MANQGVANVEWTLKQAGDGVDGMDGFIHVFGVNFGSNGNKG